MTKPKTKIGYKVVKCKGDNYGPAVADRLGIIYKLSKWIKQPTGLGPFAVFESESRAKSFAMMHMPAKVFKVEYKPTRKRSLFINGSLPEYSYYLQFQKMTITDCPTGTKFASEFKLLEKIG